MQEKIVYTFWNILKHFKKFNNFFKDLRSCNLLSYLCTPYVRHVSTRSLFWVGADTCLVAVYHKLSSPGKSSKTLQDGFHQLDAALYYFSCLNQQHAQIFLLYQQRRGLTFSSSTLPKSLKHPRFFDAARPKEPQNAYILPSLLHNHHTELTVLCTPFHCRLRLKSNLSLSPCAQV